MGKDLRIRLKQHKIKYRLSYFEIGNNAGVSEYTVRKFILGNEIKKECEDKLRKYLDGEKNLNIRIRILEKALSDIEILTTGMCNDFIYSSPIKQIKKIIKAVNL